MYFAKIFRFKLIFAVKKGPSGSAKFPAEHDTLERNYSHSRRIKRMHILNNEFSHLLHATIVITTENRGPNPLHGPVIDVPRGRARLSPVST